MLVRAERHALHAGSVGRFLRRSGRSGATAVQRDCLRHGTLQTAYRECGSLLRCVRFVRCLGSMAYTVSPVPRKSSSARFRSSLACAINPAACRMRSPWDPRNHHHCRQIAGVWQTLQLFEQACRLRQKLMGLFVEYGGLET
jgi:hypothetical protein